MWQYLETFCLSQLGQATAERPGMLPNILQYADSAPKQRSAPSKVTTHVCGRGTVYLWCYGFSGLDVVHSTNEIYLTSPLLPRPTHVQYFTRAVMSDVTLESEELWKLLGGKTHCNCHIIIELHKKEHFDKERLSSEEKKISLALHQTKKHSNLAAIKDA